MKELEIIYKEYKNNLSTIWHLALYQLKITYKGTILGRLWSVLNPLIQVGVYWIVFGIGLRNNKPVGDIDFIVWMLCGLVPWFWISHAITSGSTCVKARLKSISKMNFPLSLINGYVMLSEYIQHLIMMGICLLVVVINHNLSGFNVGVLVYYSLSTFIFLWSLSFLNSTLDIFIPDMRFLIPQVVRMLFYLTGIIWKPAALGMGLKIIFTFNPLFYVISGFRDAILYDGGGSLLNYNTVYFWSFTLFVLLVGAKLHIRLRKQFVDNI